MDRAKLAQALQVKGIPTLVLFDEKGRMITTEGRKVISMDQQGMRYSEIPSKYAGEHFPWHDLSALEEEAGLVDDASPVLKQVDVKLLHLGLQQFALRANKEARSGRIESLVLRRVKRLIDVIGNLISVVPHVSQEFEL